MPKKIDRVKEFQTKVAQMTQPKAPEDYRNGLLVPVRAHFRRQKNYMRRKATPAERDAMQDFLRGFLSGLTKE